MTKDARVLVGDVGGTHARFAVVDAAEHGAKRISHRLDLAGDSYTSFEAALRDYLERAGLEPMPPAVAIAVAGPVTAGSVTFTNRKWNASEEMLRAIGFPHALLINDFAALAFSVAAIDAKDLHTIGPELAGLADQPISILGAGTGFGVSCLARFAGRAVPLATEGGHIGFAPSDENEMLVLGVLRRKFGHVSLERVLSGPGIENIHTALSEIAGIRAEPLDAAEIVSRAERGEKLRASALTMFCAIYGAAAGDFALAHGARGGVFLAGGIAQKIEPFLLASPFRARFEAKGRLSHFVKPIPTKLIVNEDAAFLGAAAASVEFREGH